MHKTDVSELPQLKIVDLNKQKITAIIVSISAFFVLPIVGIEYLKNPQASSPGRVAGVNTITENSKIDLLGMQLTNESALLLTAGIILIGLGVVLVIFLLVDGNRQRKSQ